jgi:transposase-like protein
MTRPATMLLPVILALPLGAQSLSQRVEAAGNGTVTLTYATRTGVCGDGYVIAMDSESPEGQLVYTSDGSMHTGTWNGMTFGRRCEAGPARVRLTVRDRRVIALRPTVGSTTGSSPDRDLGTVSTVDAVNYLLDVGATGDESVTRHAFLAAAIADSAPVAPRLALQSRDRALRSAVREEALRWLARTASRDGYATEAERAIQGIARDSTDVVSVRDRAIRALRYSPGSDAFLRGLYGRLSEPALRDRVLRVVGEEPTTTTLNWIESVAVDENETVALRDRALRVLAEEHGDPARIRGLYPRLQHDALKDRAVRLVGAAGDAASEKWLLALAQDVKEPLPARERAIRMLAESGNYSQLRDLYGRTSETQLKDRIIRLVAEAGGTDNMRFVRGIVTSASESSAARERALRMLAQSGLTTSELAALYDALPDRTLRARLIQLLAERGGDPAIDKLVQIAREDTDTDLRRQAAKRLAQSGDPRAQAFFERTLKN